jgi:hypothetical protein
VSKTDIVLTECLKEMFRRVGLRYPNKKLTSQDRWYAMYAWTNNEEDDFRNWMRKYLMKRMRWRKKQAVKEVAWFNLMYSWRTPHDDGCLTILGKEKKI